jgi:hypothetical protein
MEHANRVLLPAPTINADLLPGWTDRLAFDPVDTEAVPEGLRWERQEQAMSCRIPMT